MHISKDNTHPKQKVLSVFTLVMINIIAVDSLRNLAITAEYGFSLVFFYVIGTLCFFIPIALVAAELSTAWPHIGGLYVWVKQAFGRRWGLVAIWLVWIYNIVWFPTILAFLAATFAYLVEPQLATHKSYMLIWILSVFWIATLLNCFGMKVSGWVSTIGAIVGTLMPMLIIIVLAIVWLVQGHHAQIEFTVSSLIPKIHSFNDLAFFVAVLFSLLGIEMSAIHAEDVKNPQRDYPRALTISGLIIVGSLIFASLAIAIVIPHNEISLVSGLIDAFDAFFQKFNLTWMSPIIIGMIIIGGIGSVSAWIIGPTKGLLAAADDGCLPSLFKYTSEKGAPIALLIIQALIFTILCFLFLLMPTVNSFYWVLSALTAQLAMIAYLFMFATAIRLRYSHPETPRVYTIPGGKLGIWITACLGIISCVFVIVIGFFPPSSIIIDNMLIYEAILFGGIIIFIALPLLLYKAEQIALDHL